jgi:hypothetical protein
MRFTILGASCFHVHAALSLILAVTIAGCGGGVAPEQATSSTSSGDATTGGGGSTGSASTGGGGGFGGNSGATSSTGTTGAGGGNPCVPPFVTAKPPPACGGQHSAAPTTGVACAGQLCPVDQGCCYSIGVSCGGNSCYAHADCDGPEDCATPGEVCCVSPSPNLDLPKSAYYLRAACVAKDSCVGAGVAACNTSADCPAGQTCCGTFENYGEVNMGICHAGSCD